VTHLSQNVIRILHRVDIGPEQASEKEIALAERLLRKHHSIEHAAKEMKIILQLKKDQSQW
jgi:hypothetical protein